MGLKGVVKNAVVEGPAVNQREDFSLLEIARNSTSFKPISPAELAHAFDTATHKEMSAIIRESLPELVVLSNGLVNVSPEAPRGEVADAISMRITGGERCIEFDRNALAIKSLAWLLDGSQQAWQEFRQVQKSDQLSYESFQWLSSQIKDFVKTDQDAQLLQYMVTISNAAKVGNSAWNRMGPYLPTKDFPPNEVMLDKIWKSWPGEGVDHDLKLSALLKNQPRALPVFETLDPRSQELLLESLRLPATAIGQFLQLEAPGAMLESYFEMGDRAQALFRAHALLDVIAAAGGVTQKGSLVCTESVARQFRDAYEALANGSAKDAYKDYLGRRASTLEIDLSQHGGVALTRLATMLRLQSKDSMTDLIHAFELLPASLRENLITELNEHGSDKRNATLLYYSPALLANLKSRGDSSDNTRALFKQGLEALERLFSLARRELPQESPSGVTTLHIGKFAEFAKNEKPLDEYTLKITPRKVAEQTVYQIDPIPFKDAGQRIQIQNREELALQLRRSQDLPRHEVQAALVSKLQQTERLVFEVLTPTVMHTPREAREYAENIQEKIKTFHHHFAMLSRFGVRNFDELGIENSRPVTSLSEAAQDLQEIFDRYCARPFFDQAPTGLEKSRALAAESLKELNNELARIERKFVSTPPAYPVVEAPMSLSASERERVLQILGGAFDETLLEQHFSAGGRIILHRDGHQKIDGALLYFDSQHQYTALLLAKPWLDHYGSMTVIKALESYEHKTQITEELIRALATREAGSSVAIYSLHDNSELVYPLASNLQDSWQRSPLHVRAPHAAHRTLLFKLESMLDNSRDLSRALSEANLQLSGMIPDQSFQSPDDLLVSLDELARHHRVARQEVLQQPTFLVGQLLVEIQRFTASPNKNLSLQALEAMPAIHRFVREAEGLARYLSDEITAREKALQSRREVVGLEPISTKVYRNLPLYSLESLEIVARALRVRTDNSYRANDPRLGLYGGFTFSRGKEDLMQIVHAGGFIVEAKDKNGKVYGVAVGLGPEAAARVNPRIAADYAYYGHPISGYFLGVNPIPSQSPVYTMLFDALSIESAGLAPVGSARVHNRNHRGILVYNSKSNVQIYPGLQELVASDTPHVGSRASDFHARAGASGLIWGIDSGMRSLFSAHQLSKIEAFNYAEHVGNFGPGMPGAFEFPELKRKAIADIHSVLELLRETARRDEYLDRLESCIGTADFQLRARELEKHFNETLPAYWLNQLERVDFWSGTRKLQPGDVEPQKAFVHSAREISRKSFRGKDSLQSSERRLLRSLRNLES